MSFKVALKTISQSRQACSMGQVLPPGSCRAGGCYTDTGRSHLLCKGADVGTPEPFSVAHPHSVGSTERKTSDLKIKSKGAKNGMELG